MRAHQRARWEGGRDAGTCPATTYGRECSRPSSSSCGSGPRLRKPPPSSYCR